MSACPSKLHYGYCLNARKAKTVSIQISRSIHANVSVLTGVFSDFKVFRSCDGGKWTRFLQACQRTNCCEILTKILGIDIIKTLLLVRTNE